MSPVEAFSLMGLLNLDYAEKKEGERERHFPVSELLRGSLVTGSMVAQKLPAAIITLSWEEDVTFLMIQEDVLFCKYSLQSKPVGTLERAM